jgi:hypothetical protein
MRHAYRFVPLAAVLLMFVTVPVEAQGPECQQVQFSEQVLERFPDARQSCLDVITRDGEEYAVFKAQLQEVRGNTLRVRVRNPDGSYGRLQSIRTSPGRRVLIDGRPYPVGDLAPNQELTAYVHVTRPEIALEPATASEPVEAAPLAAADASEDPAPTRLATAPPEMPATASPLENVALLGLLCLAVATCLNIIRRRGK